MINGGALRAPHRRGLFCPSESDRSAREGFSVLFLSREEARPHVHVQHAEGEAKFWIEPIVELHANYGLKEKQLADARRLVKEHLDEIRTAWASHFRG